MHMYTQMLSGFTQIPEVLYGNYLATQPLVSKKPLPSKANYITNYIKVVIIYLQGQNVAQKNC